MRNTLDTTAESEVTEVRLISYYLNDEARDVHEKQRNSGTDDMEQELFA